MSKKTDFRLYALFAILIATAIVLSDCGPTTATPVPTAVPTEQPDFIRYEVIGGLHWESGGQLLQTGTVTSPQFYSDCSVVKTDQKIILLSSIVWMAKYDDLSNIVTPPNDEDILLTMLEIPGNGKARNPLSYVFPKEPNYMEDGRRNMIEVLTETMQIGPCGGVVAKGWMYEDIDFNILAPLASQRHQRAKWQGEFYINPRYITTTFSPPTETYSGNLWLTTDIAKSFFVFEEGYPPTIVCSDEKMYAWIGYKLLGTEIKIVDSQHRTWLHKRYIGNSIPTWGNTYPPTVNTTILGAGWTIEDDRHHPYFILSIPDGCQIIP